MKLFGVQGSSFQRNILAHKSKPTADQQNDELEKTETDAAEAEKPQKPQKP